jgi:hypothetical protein
VKTTNDIPVDRDTLAELVSHVETILHYYRPTNQQDAYASNRCKQILAAHPFNGDRFTARRSRWGRYRIWDANKQSYWSLPFRSGDWSTREREWAYEKVRELNAEHRKTYAPWRNESPAIECEAA